MVIGCSKEGQGEGLERRGRRPHQPRTHVPLPPQRAALQPSSSPPPPPLLPPVPTSSATEMPCLIASFVESRPTGPGKLLPLPWWLPQPHRPLLWVVPTGCSHLFWEMGFGFFSNKNLFKKTYMSQTLPAIPVQRCGAGTPGEEGGSGPAPSHPSLLRVMLRGGSAGMGFVAPPGCLPIPRDQKEQSSHRVPGDSSVGGTHSSTSSQQHFGLLPSSCSRPCPAVGDKGTHRGVPMDHLHCTHCPYQGPWDAEDNSVTPHGLLNPWPLVSGPRSLFAGGQL